MRLPFLMIVKKMLNGGGAWGLRQRKRTGEGDISARRSARNWKVENGISLFSA